MAKLIGQLRLEFMGFSRIIGLQSFKAEVVMFS